MTKEQIREALIKAGVKNLKEYGYPGANETNILTDEIYKAFFHNMLGSEENVREARNRPVLEAARIELWQETGPA